MSDAAKLTRWAHSFLIAAGFVVVVAGMKAGQALIAPMLLAVFLAIICSPPLFWLQQKRVPSGLAVVLVIAGFVGIWLVLGYVAGSSLLTMRENLPEYQRNLRGHLEGFLKWLNDRGIDTPDDLLSQHLKPEAIIDATKTVLGQLTSLLASAALILLTAVFILLEASSLSAKMRAIAKDPTASVARFHEITKNVRHYVALKTLISLVTGVAITIALTIIGVDFPVLWGLFAFLFNFIPNIGSFIAAIPAVMLALVQLGPKQAFTTGVAYVVVNVVIGNVIEPKVMGKGLGLSPLVVFVSLVFWGWVLGPVGMLLSVMLTMIMKIVLDSNEDTRWIAVLLGTEDSAKVVLAERESDERA
ncbi:MAG: AI-2E family transporter [Planctomycetes bacterium]|nr:AI-2E family transporter [Planctomycetota bacterium]